MDEPTINEFASFANISSPNAAYKVRPTQKFQDYYNLSSAYVRQVMDRVRERFTPEEVAQMDRVLEIVGQELMPEVNLK